MIVVRKPSPSFAHAYHAGLLCCSERLSLQAFVHVAVKLSFVSVRARYSAFRQKFPKLWTSVTHSFLQQIAQNKNWAHPKATTLPRICKVEMQQASLLYYSAKPQSGGILGCALVCPTSLYVRTIRFPTFCRSLPSVLTVPCVVRRPS